MKLPKLSSLGFTPTFLIIGVAALVVLAGSFFIYQSSRNRQVVIPQEIKQPKKIGILQHIKTLDKVIDGFKIKMTELGYVEGKDIVYDYQTTGGDPSKAAGIAKEFVNKKVDMILAITSPALGPAIKETSASAKPIPIVFTNAINPVEAKFIKSYKSSGNNATGIIPDAVALSSKQVEFFNKISPKSKRIGMFSSHISPYANASIDAVRKNAEKFGITVLDYEFKKLPGPASLQEIQAIADSIKPGDIDAIMTVSDPIATAQPKVFPILNNLGKRLKIPTLYLNTGTEGLITYNADYIETGKSAAVMADKIFKGTNPADIPIEYNKRNYLEVNLKLAKELGITIPDTIIAIADRKIE
ncbi:ABC transporter substrate-binding protein [Candidatus Daviesbacteria bacterium]|nr:ABC transporter substrate-binding protein [Candidatus Daviesbacteria bacterium]